jgi:hypothetical protein
MVLVATQSALISPPAPAGTRQDLPVCVPLRHMLRLWLPEKTATVAGEQLDCETFHESQSKPYQRSSRYHKALLSFARARDSADVLSSAERFEVVVGHDHE